MVDILGASIALGILLFFAFMTLGIAMIGVAIAAFVALIPVFIAVGLVVLAFKLIKRLIKGKEKPHDT